MSTQPATVTKLSFARGVGQWLQEQGHISFASPDDLRLVCDKVAEHMTTEPIVMNDANQFVFNPPPQAELVKFAQALMHVNGEMHAQGKTASDPRAGLFTTPEVAFGDLLTKVAASATIGLGETNEKNDLANASATTGEGKQEAKKRPDGYALVGQGNANFKEPAANRVGTEQPHPAGQDLKAPGASSNSIVDATKTSSLAAILNKLAAPATGATITGADPNQQNKLDTSPIAETVMENAERPDGYALVGQGNANIKEPAPAHIGVENPHPKQPSDAEGASGNSVTDASKSAALKEIADILVPALPKSMSPEQKIAAVQYCARLEPELREAYAKELLKSE